MQWLRLAAAFTRDGIETAPVPITRDCEQCAPRRRADQACSGQLILAAEGLVAVMPPGGGLSDVWTQHPRFGYGSTGLRTAPRWQMRREKLSPAATTSWDQLLTVH